MAATQTKYPSEVSPDTKSSVVTFVAGGVLLILSSCALLWFYLLAAGHYKAKAVPAAVTPAWQCPNRTAYVAQQGDTWTSIAATRHAAQLTIPEYRVLTVELNFDPKAGNYDAVVGVPLTKGQRIIVCY